MPGHRKELGAAVIRPAEREEGFAAVAHDPRHRGEGLGVVDGGGLAVEAVARREWRLEARLAFLALERFQERRFLAANVRAVAGHGVELVAETGPEDVAS